MSLLNIPRSLLLAATVTAASGACAHRNLDVSDIAGAYPIASARGELQVDAVKTRVDANCGQFVIVMPAATAVEPEQNVIQFLHVPSNKVECVLDAAVNNSGGNEVGGSHLCVTSVMPKTDKPNPTDDDEGATVDIRVDCRPEKKSK